MRSRDCGRRASGTCARASASVGASGARRNANVRSVCVQQRRLDQNARPASWYRRQRAHAYDRALSRTCLLRRSAQRCTGLANAKAIADRPEHVLALMPLLPLPPSSYRVSSVGVHLHTLCLQLCRHGLRQQTHAHRTRARAHARAHTHTHVPT